MIRNQRVNNGLRTLPPTVAITDSSLSWNVSPDLLPYAQDWDADLIVVGNSAQSLLLRKLFGETALHLIRHADRPLFLCQ